MAERVGFEPTIPVKVCPLSRRIVSTTHAPLRKAAVSCRSPVASQSRFLRPSRSLGGRNDRRFGFGQRPTTVLDGQRLTTALKERLQHFCAAASQHSAVNLD